MDGKSRNQAVMDYPMRMLNGYGVGDIDLRLIPAQRFCAVRGYSDCKFRGSATLSKSSVARIRNDTTTSPRP